MDVFLAQLPALLGVVIGTVGTIVATRINERARWQRAQSVRWDERRLDAYASYATAVKEVHFIGMRLIPADQSPLRSHFLERAAGLELLAEAEHTRTKAWEAVLLLGDAATVDAAVAWSRAVSDLARTARDLPAGPDWADLIHAADRSRDAFYRAARASLSVAGGDVAQNRPLLTGGPGPG